MIPTRAMYVHNTMMPKRGIRVFLDTDDPGVVEAFERAIRTGRTAILIEQGEHDGRAVRKEE